MKYAFQSRKNKMRFQQIYPKKYIVLVFSCKYNENMSYFSFYRKVNIAKKTLIHNRFSMMDIDMSRVYHVVMTFS